MCGVPDSFAGFPTQTSGWRLSSWLTVAVFTSPSHSSPSGPITLRVPDSCAGFRTHLRGSRLKPLVGDSRRDSPLQFSPPSDSSSSGPITLGSWLWITGLADSHPHGSWLPLWGWRTRVPWLCHWPYFTSHSIKKPSNEWWTDQSTSCQTWPFSRSASCRSKTRTACAGAAGTLP